MTSRILRRTARSLGRWRPSAHSKLTRLLALPVVMALVGALLAVLPAAHAKAATCTANAVVCENELPGTPQSVWDVGSNDSYIQGFADPFSVNVGGSINFKISSAASAYSIDIYRMGYYGGDGARLIASITPNITVSKSQPACSTNTVTGLVDCGDWGVSATWNVPSTVVSGVYFAHIYTAGNAHENQIPFVVTNTASTSKVLFMTSDETWQAYNDWGGYSLYTGDATGSPWTSSGLDPGRAVQVSYNRPFATRYDTPYGQDFFFSMEFPTVEFLEENGYDISYTSEVNVSAPGASSMIEQHKVLLNAGHSEYWDAGARTNLTTAKNAGVSVALFTGNTMWWKTRWANSQYGNEPYRTLITYKESLDNVQSDPSDPPTWTGAWRDPRFTASGDDGGQPENALTGQLWTVNCCSYAYQVPSQYSKLALWKNTAVASLAAGKTYTSPNDETLGYEWDSDVDNGFRPAGEIDMSKTCETVSQALLTVNEDIGSTNECNSFTLYRASSGALVFDAGTVQWAWGLNNNHDGDQNGTDPALQQATVNLLAMMGVQPGTLMSGLVAGAAPTDTAAPASTITAPSAGATIANGSTVTVSGTATDSGGGVVAGVEVSTDGGATWHPVTTMSADSASVTWSYTWSAAGSGSVTIESRATDDAGNTETPGSGAAVTVNCPCSLFGNSYTPSTTSATDTSSYELGVKFQSSVAGWVAGVRFYKGSGNVGTHTGSLWSASGTLLATGTFTNETASGWQTLQFLNPIQISANTTYVASYWDPDGHYASDLELFDWALKTPPLTALQSNYVTAGAGNGVYDPGGQGFPTLQSDGASYAVDVVFDITQPSGPPPSVTSATPVAGSSSNPVAVDPSVTFSEPVVASAASLTLKDASGTTVPGTASFNSTDTVDTFTPTSALAAGTTYTVTISGVKDSFGQTMTTDTYTFTTSKAFDSGGLCPCAIWPDVAPSGATDASDTTSLELGVRFTPTQNGTINGIRFYKEPDNTGTHTGTLWTASGTELATGTFANESSTGWEELDFSTPVSVTAGTTYVASYHTTTGHYAATSGGLSSAVTNGPLTALANGGVYADGSSTTFPTNSFNGSNYWVDVAYTASATAPTVTSAAPAAGSSSNAVSVDPSVTFAAAVVPSTASFTLKTSGGTTVPGSASFNSADTVDTFTPTSALAAGSTYTVTVSGAQNSTGQTMTTDTYTFTTSKAFDSGGLCPCAIWPDVAPSGATDASDTTSLELGVRFTPTQNGTINGIRFYKEPDNTGTHTGTLWTASGTELATGTFANESSTGWEELDFSTPVSVTAGTTYVASYHTTTGHYAATSGGLSSAVTNGPLTALANGGVYADGSSTTFPTNSFSASNYWVDVVFQQDLSPPTVTTATPGNSATSVAISSAPAVTFDRAIKAGSATFSLTGPGGTAVAGTTSLNSAGTVLTFTPSSPLSPATVYHGSVSGAISAAGVAMTSAYTWSFTTSGPTVCPCTIWESDATPASPSVSDSNSVDLGVKVQVNTSGWIYGVRFYKGPGNTGTHTGSLWTDTGTLLAHGTFTSETASGWQTLEFPTAVPVSSGQTYVASYYAPNGGYAVNSGYFASSGFSNSPLQALQDGTDGGDGVYAYGGDQFPASSYGSSNYWVDPIFWTSPPPNAAGPTASAAAPLNGQTSVPTSSSVSVTFNEPVQASTIQFALTGSGGSSVAGTVSYNSSTTTATFTPTAALSSATTYTANVSGAKDSNGIAMGSPYTFSFTTAQPTPPAGQCPCSIWPDSTQPQTVTVNDQHAINLGVQFTSNENGWITGIRFYKGPNNTGTHVGSLWSSSGTLLSQVTFTSESTAGWQQASFSTPVQVTAGTVYVATYFAPNGDYSSTPAAFAASDVNNPPLDALQSSAVTSGNGVYSYGSTPAFPTSTYNATNYWVDVVFTTTAP